MTAGLSADGERQRCLQEAAVLHAAAKEAERRARGFGVAARTEPGTAAALASLKPRGYILLHDRRWPGTKSANLDHLAVGPGGVLVIDTKAWSGSIQVYGGSLFQDENCRDDAVDSVRDQALVVEEALSGLGLAPLEVVPILCFARSGDVRAAIGRVHLLSRSALQMFAMQRGRRLSPKHVHSIVEQLEQSCPPAAAKVAPFRIARRRPVVPAQADTEPATLFSNSSLELAAIDAARTRSIEDWMAFLHPEQVRLVRRSYSGPSRIRGAAGTGKTVVGLHRAAYLASGTTGRILVTSFVRTLPPVLKTLYGRLSPDTAARVEFTPLHRWARELLNQRRVRVRVDGRGADNAFSLAYSRWAGRAALARPDTPVNYWRDEIDAVIKGRGLTSFEQYDQLRRVGRKTRLTTPERRLVWDLYVEYDRLLLQRGIQDFNDLLALALDSVEEEPLQQPYRAVIADEVQDLNLLGVRLLHALVDDAADGLTLIGDGQQAVYPGGFTLSEAGISVSGRATVLRTNYRNTRQILEYASALVAEDDFDDLEAEQQRGARDVVALREGEAPVELHARSLADHDRVLTSALAEACGRGVRAGDIAVLVATNQLAYRYIGILRKAGLPAVSLEDYDGRQNAGIKVGTFKRAKGLEFARVFLPQTRSLPQAADAEPGTIERLERERREYFVAMTRARDALWVGFVGEFSTAAHAATA